MLVILELLLMSSMSDLHCSFYYYLSVELASSSLIVVVVQVDELSFLHHLLVSMMIIGNEVVVAVDREQLQLLHVVFAHQEREIAVLTSTD